MGHAERFAPNSEINLKSRRRTWARWIVGLLVVVGAGVVLRLTMLAPDIPVVVTGTVERGTVEETITNTRAGTVRVRRRASLSPEIGGRVARLPVSEGDSVAAGQLLLQLDDTVQRDQLRLVVEDVRVARAKAEEACFGADLAEKEASRQEDLHQRGIASDGLLDRTLSERDRSAAACRAAKAVVGQAEAQEILARTRLEQARMVAPFDGVVAEVSTEVGEWITPSPPGLPIPAVIDLLNLSGLYVSAPIDEMDAERVHLGQDVRISVDSRKGQSFEGRLVRVAPYVLDLVEQNRTVEVEAEFLQDGESTSILPGTSADLEIIIERRSDVLMVPTTAIADGDTVLVVGSGEVLEERTIVTGLGNWRMTEIVEGLNEGERIVTLKRSPKLVDGVRVQLEEQP